MKQTIIVLTLTGILAALKLFGYLTCSWWIVFSILIGYIILEIILFAMVGACMCMFISKRNWDGLRKWVDNLEEAYR